MTREGLIKKAAGAIRAAWSDKANPTDFDLAIAALSAIEAAGVRLVPVEATPTMAYVGTDARWQSAVRDANNVREIWRAMLAASPYAPAQKDESHE